MEIAFNGVQKGQDIMANYTSRIHISFSGADATVYRDTIAEFVAAHAGEELYLTGRAFAEDDGMHTYVTDKTPDEIARLAAEEYKELIEWLAWEKLEAEHARVLIVAPGDDEVIVE